MAGPLILKGWKRVLEGSSEGPQRVLRRVRTGTSDTKGLEEGPRRVRTGASDTNGLEEGPRRVLRGSSKGPQRDA